MGRQHNTAAQVQLCLKVSASRLLNVLMLNEMTCGSVTDTGTSTAQNQIITSLEGNKARTAPRWTVVQRRGTTFPVKTFTNASARWLRFSCTESRDQRFCRTGTRLRTKKTEMFNIIFCAETPPTAGNTRRWTHMFRKTRLKNDSRDKF